MQIFLTIVGLIVIAMIATYLFFPRTVLQFARGALRRKAKLTRKTVNVGDDEWPYLEGGPDDGEALLLIHGYGGDKDNWAMFAPDIVKKYRLIAPDLPGFGENFKDPDRDYDMVTQAARIRDFLDALGIDKCHIGGNSMGGLVALHFALDFPERLRSLTLYNNAGVVGEGKSRLQKEVRDGSNPLGISSADDVKRLMAYVAYKPIKVPGQFRKIFYEDFAMHRDVLDKIFFDLAEETTERPLNDKLGNIHVPTLIIWGRHDQLIDVSCVDVLDKGIADSEAVILEDVGHLPMIEKPKITAQHQLAFLAKH